jgi:hypothetical protein
MYRKDKCVGCVIAERYELVDGDFIFYIGTLQFGTIKDVDEVEFH